MYDINIITIIFTVAILAIYFISLTLLRSYISSYGYKRDFKEKRIIYINKLVSILLLICLFTVLSLIWNVNFNGLLVLGSSFFALTGVALFASWSNLSNLTSSLIIFFSLPFKIDDEIKILDSDNTVEGKIIDMTMFYVLIEDKEKNLVSYPNNIFLQKAVTGKK